MGGRLGLAGVGVAVVGVCAYGSTHLKRAFSAPRICTVEEGCLARLRRDPTRQESEKEMGVRRVVLSGGAEGGTDRRAQ